MDKREEDHLPSKLAEQNIPGWSPDHVLRRGPGNRGRFSGDAEKQGSQRRRPSARNHKAFFFAVVFIFFDPVAGSFKSASMVSRRFFSWFCWNGSSPRY